MSELASGLDYLLGFSDVGIALASEGSASLSDLLAGVLTAATAALALGALLALRLRSARAAAHLHAHRRRGL